ncbi:CBS domain-containing protein, partial [Myxococcota bacterium]|nr:CBS domain-containing protein [Myxococcota bacterium]MBU1534495.1 CBS domain-containing protein [Myxococcota bacterium]
MSLSNTKLEMIRRLIRRQLIGPLGKILDTLKAADLGEIMVKLTPEEQRIILTTLHLSGKAGELLAELPEKNLREILQGISDSLFHKILTQIQADDAAMLLEQVDKIRAFELLEKLPVAVAEKIEEIMRYPHGTAGSMMNTAYLEFYEATTAKDALEKLRAYTRDTNDPIYSIYVMDETRKLMGAIPIRTLALARPTDHLEEIMDRDPVVVHSYASTDDAARLITKYDLVSLPVVDENFRFMGIIMVDDMIESIMESMADDAFLMQGITEQDRLETPVLRSVRSRLPWMAINLLTAFVASSVVGIFEHSIAQVVALATFMPIVAGLGGNTGT